MAFGAAPGAFGHCDAAQALALGLSPCGSKPTLARANFGGGFPWCFCAGKVSFPVETCNRGLHKLAILNLHFAIATFPQLFYPQKSPRPYLAKTTKKTLFLREDTFCLRGDMVCPRIHDRRTNPRRRNTHHMTNTQVTPLIHWRTGQGGGHPSIGFIGSLFDSQIVHWDHEQDSVRRLSLFSSGGEGRGEEAHLKLICGLPESAGWFHG